jgi:hypothetical protein
MNLFAAKLQNLLALNNDAELIEFGDNVFPTASVGQLGARALTATDRWHKRQSKQSPLLALFGTLFAALNRQLNLEAAFELSLCAYRDSATPLDGDGVTLNNFHASRKRLGSKPLEYLLHALADSFPETVDPRFGRCLKALDATKINVPNSEANRTVFGSSSNQHGPSRYPQLLLNCLVTVHDRICRRAKIYPCNTDEHRAAIDFLEYLTVLDLFIVDRGIPSGQLFHELQKRQIAFAIRIPVDWNVTVIKRLGSGDNLVVLERTIDNPDGSSTKVRLRVRLLEFKIESEAVRVATSLTEPLEYPKEWFVDVYHERWQIEIAFDECKNTMGAPKRGGEPLMVRSKSPDLVKQELFALLAVHGLIRDAGRQAAEASCSLPREFSFSAWFNRSRIHIQERTPANRRRIQLATTACRLPKRSPEKTRRYYPRQALPIPNKWSFRKDYGQRIRDITPTFAESPRTVTQGRRR